MDAMLVSYLDGLGNANKMQQTIVLQIRILQISELNDMMNAKMQQIKDAKL